MRKEIQMKRIYIKPETELTTCRLCGMLAASKTEWHTGTDGQGDDNPVGPQQPDPNADAKQYTGGIDLWADEEDDW